MSSVDDKRKNTIPRESGKRLYMSDMPYSEHMRQGTIKGMESGNFPWSEFEKPYREDSYEEMEYLMWNFPGFPEFDMEFDNPSFPTTEGASLGGGGFLVFECQVYGGFCTGDTRNVAIDCSHPITGIALSSDVLYGREFSVSLETQTSIAITAEEDAGGGVEIDVFMQSAGGVVGSHENILIGSASDCEDCDSAATMEADPDNASVVLDSTNYSIGVLYGVGPFAWSLQADDSPDVALQNAVTDGRTNTLQVTDGCGTIIVTVTDSCGTEVEMSFFGDGVWNHCQTGSRVGSGCTCTAGSQSNAEVADDNPFYINVSGKRWRVRDISSSSCFGQGTILGCCSSTSPCSSLWNCFPLFNVGTLCYDGVTTPICLNPCSGGCGITVRTGQDARLEVWECV